MKGGGGLTRKEKSAERRNGDEEEARPRKDGEGGMTRKVGMLKGEER